MKYPKEYLDEIKLKLKVSQVIGQSVKLKKRGKLIIETNNTNKRQGSCVFRASGFPK